ncbi:MAG: LD-carboxypeptidase [Planctomycetes bacterium]|nr:LD-carboxypeptidase [Planctomycetota bacterium]
MNFSNALLSFALVSSTFVISTAHSEPTPAPIYPKALAPGDTIVFVAPAKYLDKDRVSLAKKRLEEMGFKVRLPENLFRKQGFLGGSDEERAAELMAAFADPEIDAIFPGTGGYGTTRILDKLDYDVIRRNPKVFIGFSDITALHIALNQRTGLVTFHSPNPMFGLGGDDNLSPFAAKWFWRALLANSYNDPNFAPQRAGSSPTPVPQRAGPSSAPRGGYTIETRPRDGDKSDDASIFDGVPRAVTFADGKARGRLIGGNLSVLHALMGTPFEIDTDDKILFLEDVGEAPYRVDRMLSTLRLAGKFDGVKGVILGAFTAREDEAEWDDDASIDDVLRDYFANLGIPVLAHFPVGHVRYNATLPIGALVELDATQQTLRLLENPASP